MRKAIFITLAVLILGLTGYVYWNYYFVVEDGSKEGMLQSFAREGTVFRTFEGDMVQMGFGMRRGNGLSSNHFYFSVLDEKLADSMQHNCQGKMLLVHYVKYRRSLPWRGANTSKDNTNQRPGQYIVDRVEQVREVPAGMY